VNHARKQNEVDRKWISHCRLIFNGQHGVISQKTEQNLRSYMFQDGRSRSGVNNELSELSAEIDSSLNCMVADRVKTRFSAVIRNPSSLVRPYGLWGPFSLVPR
jgi:hypothetical protein